MPSHRIAVIPGDGIGKEVIPEGLRALGVRVMHHGIAPPAMHLAEIERALQNAVSLIDKTKHEVERSHSLLRASTDRQMDSDAAEAALSR